MTNFWMHLAQNLPRVTPAAILDILLVAFLIYQGIIIVRGRRAARLLVGVGFVLLAYGASVWLQLDLLRTILERATPYTAFAVIVLFQSEIRRFLTRLSPRNWVGFGRRLEVQETSKDILLAVQDLARSHTGALIVIERQSGLRTFIESGVPMDAELTLQLLMAIFHKESPLHDGAVIVQGNRIAAAACFLPITTNPTLSRRLGTRHRAGIGITEESDCLSIIVSEETGQISLARAGDIEMNLSLETLAQRLGLSPRPDALHQQPPPPQPQQEELAPTLEAKPE